MEQILNNLAKGMVRNTNNLKKDPQYYNFALNISTDKNQLDRLSRVTEHSLEDYYTLKNTDYVILNALYLNLEEYVFFITDKKGSFSEILYYNNGSITTKYNNPLLNFKPTNIISSTYRVNYNGDRLIYFVDGLNKDRVFNLDNITLVDNIESLSVNPIYDYSHLIDYNINYTGGNLKAGKYWVFVQPKDINFKTAQFKYVIDGIPIENGNYYEELIGVDVSTDDSMLDMINTMTSFNEVYGLKEDTFTSKSIDIKLDNINSNFTNVDIYIIIKKETTYETYLKENVIISPLITIASLEDYTLLGSDISTVIVNNIIYNGSEALVQKDNRLILANSKLEEYNLDFQAIANNIIVKPVTREEFFNTQVRIPGTAASVMTPTGREFNLSSPNLNGTFNEKYIFSLPAYEARTQKKYRDSKTFMRDEVYALGVYFELANGVFTDVYHIPGRKANDVSLLQPHIGKMNEAGIVLSQSNIGSYDNGPIIVEDEVDQAWRLSNTGLEGLMGYYRCEEVYPDGYGFPTDGEKNPNNKSYIRHHRIPSEYIYPLLKEYTGGLNTKYNKKLLINLEFSNIVLPPKYAEVIKKIYFTSANRSENNKKVLSKGIVYANRTVANGGVVRNSESLNAPNTYNNSTKSPTVFEFKSPEVDFRFKESNIKGNYLKSISTLAGWVKPFTKHVPSKTGAAPGTTFPVPGSYINYEGISRSTPNFENVIYDYKQELVLNRVDYSVYVGNNGLPKVFKLEDINFVDNNSHTTVSNSTLNYEGNQNTSVLKLKNNYNPAINSMFTTADLDDVPSYFKTGSFTGSSALYRNFFFQEQENANNDYTREQRDISRFLYYDSTKYVSILSNNKNIYSNILSLVYTRLTGENNIMQGDTFIENHFTKKGYSTLVTSGSYKTVVSSYNTKDVFIVNVTNPAGDFNTFSTVDKIDMTVSESYISFPVETRMNIRMRRHDDDNNHFPYNTMSANYPTNVLEKKALTQEKFTLDRKYYNEESIIPLTSNIVRVNDLDNLNRKIGNRIIYSELQNNESNIDNFRNFKANNYKDIITTRGDIHKLFIKDNNLYILTRDSLFSINSSNNYLTTKEGGSIYVGSGEFLGVEPEELISLETGFAGTSSKLSFYENKFGYTFIDTIRNKVMLFSKGLIDLNTLGLDEDFTINLFKYFPQLNNGQDQPLLGYGLLSGFDPETDRLFYTKLDYIPTDLMLSEFNSNLITIKDGLFYKNNVDIDFNNKDYFINKSFTVTLDGLSNVWISYHDYFPKYYIPNPRIFTPQIKSIQKYGKNFASKFIIDVSMNKDFNIVKVFDSLKFDVRSEDVNNTITNNFFNKLIIYNDTQTTGLVNLDSKVFNNNLTKKENYWNFNNILDISKEGSTKKLFSNDWSLIKNDYYIDKVLDPNQLDYNKPWNKKHRLRDKYVNVRLIKDNNINNKFTINYLIANVRQSIR